jgi:hypothetical protein
MQQETKGPTRESKSNNKPTGRYLRSREWDHKMQAYKNFAPSGVTIKVKPLPAESLYFLGLGCAFRIAISVSLATMWGNPERRKRALTRIPEGKTKLRTEKVG